MWENQHELQLPLCTCILMNQLFDTLNQVQGAVRKTRLSLGEQTALNRRLLVVTQVMWVRICRLASTKESTQNHPSKNCSWILQGEALSFCCTEPTLTYKTAVLWQCASQPYTTYNLTGPIYSDVLLMFKCLYCHAKHSNVLPHKLEK